MLKKGKHTITLFLSNGRMLVGNYAENDNAKMSITLFLFYSLSHNFIQTVSKRSFPLFIFLEHLITWADYLIICILYHVGLLFLQFKHLFHQSLISNIEKIVINEIRKDLDPLSRSMDASNGWSVQLEYALDPETAPTWPDMSPIHSDHHRILRWYNKDTAMTFLRL